MYYPIHNSWNISLSCVPHDITHTFLQIRYVEDILKSMDPDITSVTRLFLQSKPTENYKITLIGGIEERIQNETISLFGLQLEVPPCPHLTLANHSFSCQTSFCHNLASLTYSYVLRVKRILLKFSYIIFLVQL